MTQREILESMLQKYGEIVQIKGNSVKGMIRPLQYKSASSLNLLGRYDCNLHSLYTGPISQKLCAGDELSTASCNYIVKRTDTARIGGDELYVWAVLGVLVPDAVKEIYLEADGRRVAVIGSYTEQGTQQSRAIAAWGEQEPVGTAPGRIQYTVTVENVCPADGIDLYALTDFALIIAKPALKVVYSGCRWKNIEAAGEAGSTAYRKMEFVAAKRTEEAESNEQ